jgi:hypothetical protein
MPGCRRPFVRLATGLALAALGGAAACGVPGSPLGNEPLSHPEDRPGLGPATAAGPHCVALRTGSKAVGQVCVLEEGGELVVEITALGGRHLRSTALALADDPADFPLNSKGAPVVSRFPFREEHPDVVTYTARLSLGGSATGADGTVYVAAYAVVVEGTKQKAAWGEGIPFARDGMYFAFDRSQQRLAFLVIGDPDLPNSSETRMKTRLEGFGYEVEILGVSEFSVGRVAGCDVVLIAQTVDDDLGARPKPLTCGILFWDDNSQRVDFLSTIRNDCSIDCTWHRSDTLMYVIPGAPAELRAGLSGLVKFYTRSDEISWAPRADLPANATQIAKSRHADYNPAMYYYDRGQILADGTPAAGRRIFFGVHRDSFKVLTPEGLALFDAALEWAAH